MKTFKASITKASFYIYQFISTILANVTFTLYIMRTLLPMH